MKIEYLTDYEAREVNDAKRFAQIVSKEGLRDTDTFPELERFSKFNEPIAIADTTTYLFDKEKIWSQIPFAGTLIIPLVPANKENLLRMNGFEATDIPKMVDLAKETGKIQFTLRANAQSFADLDHFDPIFTELTPPALHVLPTEAFTDPETFEEWQKEFFLEASTVYWHYLLDASMHMGQGATWAQITINSDKLTYAYLRVLKLNDTADNILKLLVLDPEQARFVLDCYRVILHPRFNGLRRNWNQSLAKLKHHHVEQLQVSTQFRYDVEIGRYLLKKKILYPTSYSACIDIIHHYEHNDLYKTLESFNESVRKNKENKMVSDLKELNEILDNSWNAARKIGLQKEILRDGINVVLGIVGFATSAGLGGIGGLLGGLGLNVLERKLDSSGFSITDKMIKILNADYLVNIYDFQNKHPIN